MQKIGLIGAMNEEIELILSSLQKENTTVEAGILFHEGFFHGKQVVLCKSGVGKVNAAVCTQILIDRFGVDGILFTGVAGALDPSLNIGDIVISTECQQHDIDVTALGFPKGTIPFSEQSVFAAERGLVDLAYSISESLFPGRSVKGRVLSGDQFIADRNKVMQLYAEMNGVCTEMEGAAVAQVCGMNDVPFLVIRSMSDKADGTAHVNFAEFTETAAKHSFMIVQEMMKALG